MKISFERNEIGDTSANDRALAGRWELANNWSMAKSDDSAVNPSSPNGDEQLDTTVDVVTPENIAFKYNVAGPFRRLCAFFADSAIIVGFLVVLAILFMLIAWGFSLLFTRLLGASPEAERGIAVVSAVLQATFFVVWFCSYWSFGALFETFWNGQTPGKWMMGIRVLSSDGQPINGLQAVLRNVLRAADSFPLLSPAIFAGTFIGNGLEGMMGDEGPWGEGAGIESLSHYTVIPTFMVGLTFMMLNRRFLRVGDLVCGTMVVLEERSWLVGVARVEDPRTPDLAALLPPGFQVSRGLARAVATYVERRRFFSVPRRREIARHLGEPLLAELGMPLDTSHDLLLCAIYYRTFVTDRSNGMSPNLPVDPVVQQPVPAVDGITYLDASAPPPTQPTQY